MNDNKNLKIGFIGLGGRGQGMLHTLLQIKDVTVTAVCDIIPERLQKGLEIAQKDQPGVVVDTYLDYKELLKREDITAVVICTTWITHIKIAVAAMNAGKHAAMEVGGAASIEECFDMVRTAERTGKICMLLENCCYDRNELAVFNIVKKGLFGEIVYCAGGYQHDLREEICHGKENQHGRLKNFIHRNGEVYPTHELGPLAKLLNINRGNRFTKLTSNATKAAGLKEWIKDREGENYYLANQKFNLGDIITTVITTSNGENIVLTHDCSLPRPYSRGYRVQGTKGLYMEDGQRIFFDLGKDGDEFSWLHNFEDFIEDGHRKKHDHPLWIEYEKEGVKAGHGGMDYLVLCAFCEAAKDDLQPPIDVYDTATWMAITCLSENSIALGGALVPVPDFTNGAWIEREPTRRGKYCLDEVCEEFFNFL